LEPKVNGKVIR